MKIRYPVIILALTIIIMPPLSELTIEYGILSDMIANATFVLIVGSIIWIIYLVIRNIVKAVTKKQD